MKSITLLAILLASVLSTAAHSADAPGFVVIVNAANLAALTREQVADIFMKRLTRWDDGQPVAAVDALPDAAVREEFSRVMLRRGVPAMEAYWQQQIFSGRDMPPIQKDSDAEIVAYVRKMRGAIGYVSAGTPLDGVRAVNVRSEP
jgi:ABC-type phosphate transport system substrate-binding protein